MGKENFEFLFWVEIVVLNLLIFDDIFENISLKWMSSRSLSGFKELTEQTPSV